MTNKLEQIAISAVVASVAFAGVSVVVMAFLYF